MYGIILFAVTASSLFAYFILWPVVDYFRDPKGLRKYPNLNFLSGVTDLGFLYEAHKGFRSKALLEAHQKSPVVRIGPNSLSYSDLSAIKDIYGHNTKCVKDLFYDTLAGSHHHLADVRDKLDHQRKRRILSSAYALKNLEGWEHKVADKTERFIKAADARCTEPLKKGERPTPESLTFDYRAYSNFFTLDAIADIGLSERLGFLDQGHDLVTAETMDGKLYQVNYRKCLHATARGQAGTVWAYDWYPFFWKVAKFFSKDLGKLNAGWNDIVWHRSTQRLARYRAGEQLDDFFSALMDDKNGNPNGMEWGEIVAEISIMMNAGSDTTAIAMNNAMYLLLKNPECLAKLQAELDAVVEPSEVVIAYDTIRHLPYLRACLDEALRMFPPSTFGLPRRTPPEGAPILGDFIPGETSVSISAYVAHRDEKVFPEPEKFMPERWLGEDAKELQAAFITFSAGARGCIGRNISYLEQTVLLASVVHRFEWALPSPDWTPDLFEAFNLSPGPMPLKVWKRFEDKE
ncbi:Benzoate 4-monooxygenase [Lachnellula hyalina]|uniref:Benzoate 4-monooxygenase n=1 Tax=Lachnellula hyalina TaxID=1316788 RepID=A0A8H8R612_9HELO|nr:Benzoate 4-monooxygenase [Lachnellula hyalina]TVY28266.1 Benzoate 4-monooxygenase [Lachnellula hyalina]